MFLRDPLEVSLLEEASPKSGYHSNDQMDGLASGFQVGQYKGVGGYPGYEEQLITSAWEQHQFSKVSYSDKLLANFADEQHLAGIRDKRTSDNLRDPA